MSEFNPKTEHDVRLENISLKKELADLRAERDELKKVVEVLIETIKEADSEPEQKDKKQTFREKVAAAMEATKREREKAMKRKI